MRIVTDCAAFAHRFMLENKWSRLFAMTLRATLVQPGHCQSAGRFEDVAAVGVVALNAIHPAFNEGMMLRLAKFSFGLQMALETSVRIFAGVYDEFAAPPANFNVFAARTMAGFASRLAAELRVIDMDPRMRAGRKNPRDVGVAFAASPVADISCAWNVRRRNNCSSESRTRNCKK